MEIRIDAAAVERAVQDAILASAIGDKVKKAVTELLAKSWDNPIDKAVQQVVLETAVQIVRTDHGDAIRAAIKEKVTEAMMDDLANKLWERLLNR